MFKLNLKIFLCPWKTSLYLYFSLYWHIQTLPCLNFMPHTNTTFPPNKHPPPFPCTHLVHTPPWPVCEQMQKNLYTSCCLIFWETLSAWFQIPSSPNCSVPRCRWDPTKAWRSCSSSCEVFNVVRSLLKFMPL